MNHTIARPERDGATPASVVVPRQLRAKAALATAEKVITLKTLRRRLHAGMSLADVYAAIDEQIGDLQNYITSLGSANNED